MKSIKTLVALALAAGFASVSFAASDAATAPTPVPKNEAAMRATAAVSAQDAAANSVKPAGKKAAGKHVKAKSAKKHKAKTAHAAHAAK